MKKTFSDSGVTITINFDTKGIMKAVDNNFGGGSRFMIDLEQEILFGSNAISDYVPLDQGPLKESAYRNTERGSGKLIWGGAWLKAQTGRDYAVINYFRNLGKSGGKRGKRWIERWIDAGNVPVVIERVAKRHGVKTK